MEVTGPSDVAGSLKGREIPITRATMRFGLNRIPEATFVLPVGIDVLTSKLSAAYAMVDEADSRMNITVYCQGSGDMYEGKDGTVSWPAEAKAIWHGYISSVGYARTAASYSFTVTSAHWMVDLDKGTLALADMYPGGLDFFGFITSIGGVTGAYGKIDAVGLINTAQASSTGDLWAEALEKILTTLMLPDGAGGSLKGDSVYKKFIEGSNCALSDVAAKASYNVHPGNRKAATVISSSGAGRHMHDKSNILVLGGGNLPLGDITNSVARDYLEYLATVVLQSIGSSSAWDKLVTLGQLGHFNIVSNVETAAAVPNMPVFPESQVWRTLNPEHYLQVEGQSTFPRIVSGVVYRGGIKMTTGLNVEDQELDVNAGAAAAYLGVPDGHIIVRNAPQWLVGDMSDKRTKEDISGKNAGNAATPRSPNTAETKATRSVGCDYAHSAWAYEYYKFRAVQIASPIRFDICPGSCLRLRGLSTNQFAGGTESQLFGHVVDVTIVLDAEAKQAYSQFALSHIRSAADEASGLVPEKHPLYGNNWPGSPLVKLNESDLEQE